MLIKMINLRTCFIILSFGLLLSQCHARSSLPPPLVSPNDITNIVNETLFDEMVGNKRNDPSCPAQGFYTYDAFITAARSFPEFGATGDRETRLREVAAFFAQTSHETAGGHVGPKPGDSYVWRYCYVKEVHPFGDYCIPFTPWPCVPGKKYYGRGPIQLRYNYNYGPAGEALGLDLLSNPDQVATNSSISFQTAIWFWMTQQSPKIPSCHAAVTGTWTPTADDIADNRLPGFGVTTNILNGGVECGHGPNPPERERIFFYFQYCELLGVSPDEKFDCGNQKPFDPFVDGPGNPKRPLLKMPVDQA